MFSINKIPEKLNICGHIFDVDLVNADEMINNQIDNPANISFIPETKENEDMTLGEMSYSELKIRLLKGLPKEILNTTLLHEIVEAINEIYELRLPHYKISILENAFYQLMKNN